jgi:hypothetical protein
MSATADAYIVAIQRAFPKLTETERFELSERFFAGNATPDEEDAIEREFSGVTRADIGGQGVLADLNNELRRCCDCDGWFDGPGPRCPVCVDLRNKAGQANDLRLLRAAAGLAVDAIDAALESADTGNGFGAKEYESLWDAMIGLKNELPKA